jgi:hypothetical protein
MTLERGSADVHRDEPQALYEALCVLERKAETKLTGDPVRHPGDRRPTRYSRREAAQAARIASQRISDWVPKNSVRAPKVPRDLDAMWPLIEVWVSWADDSPDKSYWDRLLQEAQDRSGARRAGDQADLAAPLGKLITEMDDPFDLEVHRAIEVGAGLPELPAYVSRDHDAQLSDVLKAVAPPDGGSVVSRIAILVGGSSTGKTRACWEALQALPAGWRVWHPLTVERLLAGIDPAESGQPSSAQERLVPHTVIWLNELQRYLLPTDTAVGEQSAIALKELLADKSRAPVLVLGSIWPIREHWETLITRPHPTNRDLHAHARRLVTGNEIMVPGTIGSDLAAAQQAASTDPRWRLALAQNPEQPIQFMAGAVYLIDRYENASPEARAVLNAMGDARRLGASAQLPLAFLEQAARDYLSDTDWDALSLGDTWVRDVIENHANGLCIGALGVRGPLHRVRDTPPEAGPGCWTCCGPWPRGIRQRQLIFPSIRRGFSQGSSPPKAPEPSM